jgi:hypothetical protein
MIKKKWWIFLLVLLALIIAGALGFRWFTNRLERQIQEKMLAAGMTFTYDAIHWHIIPQGVSFENLHLAKANNADIFSLDLKEAKIYLHLGDLLRGNLNRFSDVELSDGNLTIFPDSLKEPKKDTTSSQGLEIDQFQLQRINVIVQQKKRSQFNVQSFTGSFKTQPTDSGTTVTVKDVPIRFVFTDCSLAPLFKHHYFTSDTITYDMPSKQLRCITTKVIPVVSRPYMDKHEPYIMVHAKIAIPEIVFSGIEWSYQNTMWVHVKKILVNNLMSDVYQNQEEPLIPGSRPMPLEMIDFDSVKFMIDTLDLRNAAFLYTITPNGEPIIGEMPLDKWDLILLNIGNEDVEGSSLSATTKMRWMKSAFLEAKVSFPYGDPNGAFQISGNFSPSDFMPFNGILEAAEGLRFLSGHCNRFRFAFRGDKRQMGGKVWLDFQDVKIAFNLAAKIDLELDKKANKEQPQNKKNKQGQSKPKKGNKFLDKYVAKNIDNPKRGMVQRRLRASTDGKLLEVKVQLDRNQQQSVFSLWVKGIITGLKGALKD